VYNIKKELFWEGTMQRTKECPFMGIERCFKQDVKDQRSLNYLICTCCILSRVERHLFEMKQKSTVENTNSKI
jgi:hypothetical protein